MIIGWSITGKGKMAQHDLSKIGRGQIVDNFVDIVKDFESILEVVNYKDNVKNVHCKRQLGCKVKNDLKLFKADGKTVNTVTS